MRFFRTAIGYRLSVIGFSFLLFTAHCSLLTVLHAQGNSPFLTDKDQFNYAMFLYKQGHYQVAAREFGRVIEYFPGSPIVPHAQYMIGDAYLNASVHREAKNQFEQFMKNFPDSEFNAEAALKLGMAKAKLKDAELISAPKLPVIKVQPCRDMTCHALTEPTTPIRVVQIALFESKDYQGVDDELNKLKAAGIDTIILRVFHNKGDRFYPFINISGKSHETSGVYFKTKESPLIEDVLAPVLSMAHKKELKVFAWMTTRYADYGIEQRKDMACKAYDIYSGDTVACKGLDLFNEDAVRHLERVFQDLAGYPIDGILFQDDLVLKHNEGFGRYSEALYKKDTGRMLIPAELYINEEIPQYTPEFWKWAAWKNKRLLQVAVRLRAVVKNKNPDARFAINLMYESVSNPPNALAWLSQSLDAAVKQGFDYYAIMAYHRQMQDELKKEPYEINSLIQKMANEAVRLVGEPCKVLMKFQTIDWNTSQPLPDDDVITLLNKVKEVGNISLAVAPYRRDFPFEEIGGQKKVTQLLR
ncbi:MAG: tetratricopeptide repeat protein [Deltaproteobacteria bacterium]|nr:tetratricopeptide repeat protein [Deltaproteobacteria bacterium]